jgi:hypothetical protein
MKTEGEPMEGTESKTAAKPKKYAGAMVVLLLVGIMGGIALGYLWLFLAFDASHMTIIAIFAVSTMIGLAGAMVFLIVQMLMAEENLSVMGRIVRSKYAQPSLMMALFILSGGLVAGFSQASVGSFNPGNIWTTFLIGFGWQGVIAGVSSSAAIRDKGLEGEEGMKQVKDASVDMIRVLNDQMKTRLQELQDQLHLAEKAVPPKDGTPLGEILTQGGPQ